VKSGATPTSIVRRGAESSPHGIFAAMWPLMMWYSVVSYRCIKPPAGIVSPASNAKTESLTVVVPSVAVSFDVCSCS